MPLNRTKSKTDYGADYTTDFTGEEKAQHDYTLPVADVMTKSTEEHFDIDAEFADPEFEVEGNGERHAKEERDFDAGNFSFQGSETKSTGWGLS